MQIKNYEFKAKVDDIVKYENLLQSLDPVFKGLDYQKDTYFNARSGRLKLREGNIENALIDYDREDIADGKESQVILYRHNPDKALKEILIKQLGVKVVVEKRRKIYFIDNVKFHFDKVYGLGTFLEVEAIDSQNIFTIDELKGQCDAYFSFFGLKKVNLVDKSYSDLLLEVNE